MKHRQTPLRRVVTGVDEQGRSVVERDGPCQCAAVTDQYVSEDLWLTGLPAPREGSVDIPQEADLDPGPGTLVWRRFRLGPQQRIEFHSTDTVDLMTVLSGEMTLVLETGTVRLTPGDCVVQRGTRHGWINDGAEECVLIGVMISTEPEATE